MPQTILAVDAGNSRTKLGVCAYDGGGIPSLLHFVARPAADQSNWHDWLRQASVSIDACAVAGSDVGQRDRMIDDWPAELPTPLAIRDYTQCGLPVSVDHPEQVGLDRLLNALGANLLRDAGQPAIVVDSGTATTVDLVGPDGSFNGGAILPGPALGARALHDHTAALPLIDVDELTLDQTTAVGQNTHAAIASGLVWGQVGAVRELVQRLGETLSAGPKPLLILTGGGAGKLAGALSDARIQPGLGLQALAMLAADAACG